MSISMSIHTPKSMTPWQPLHYRRTYERRRKFCTGDGIRRTHFHVLAESPALTRVLVHPKLCETLPVAVGPWNTTATLRVTGQEPMCLILQNIYSSRVIRLLPLKMMKLRFTKVKCHPFGDPATPCPQTPGQCPFT